MPSGHQQQNDRDRLIEECQPLVRSVARRAQAFAWSVGSMAELDDLLSLAQEGLVKATESYDPSRGVPFTAYARLRVAGHVKNALRNDGFLTRREREDAQAWLRGDDLSERRARQAARLVSQRRELVAPEVVDEVPGDNQVEDLALAHVQVDEVLRRLSPVQRSVFVYRYLRGMSFSAIGVLLRLTESGVSRAHQAALHRLRELEEAS